MSDALWTMISEERHRLADDTESLSEEQWNTPSLCPGWRVRDVIAHLVYPHEHGKGAIFVDFLKAGFNVNTFGLRTATADGRPAAQFPAALRSTADKRWEPPGGYGPVAPLTDIIAHGQDIRRALGTTTTFGADRLSTVLDFVVTKKATRGFTKKGVVDGLRLEATDIGWSHGDGPAVTGPGEALLMSVLGRSIANAELSGDGLDTLRTRA